MAFGVTPEASGTTIGVRLSEQQTQSWPLVPKPQPYRFPSEPIAWAEAPPPVTAVGVTPAGSETTTGVELLVALPLPRAPFVLRRQE